MIKVVREVGLNDVLEVTANGATKYAIRFHGTDQYRVDANNKTLAFQNVEDAVDEARRMATVLHTTGIAAKAWMPRESFNHKPENKKQKV